MPSTTPGNLGTVHAPELVADFHQRYPGVARCNQAVEFDLINSGLSLQLSRRDITFLEGGWMLGDPQHRTFLPDPLPYPRLSTSHLSVVAPSLYCPHPSTISSPSTHHHLIVSLFPVIPSLLLPSSVFPFPCLHLYPLSHTAYSIILLFYGSTFIY